MNILLVILISTTVIVSAQSQPTSPQPVSAAVPLWKDVPKPPPMPPADQSGYAPINGIKMYYAIFNKGGGDPVILLHGGGGSSEAWGFEVPLLARNHKVIVADSRGHGRSTRTEQPFSYDLMATDVLALMDYLKIKKASVVGWSDGGIIGLVIAIRHPERLKKLFAFGANFNTAGLTKESPDPALMARLDVRREANYRRLSPTPNDYTNFMRDLEQMWETQPDLKPSDLGAITVPTMIADGDHDEFILREHTETLAHLIPRAQLWFMPNASHYGGWQDHIHFHEAVVKFLDGNRSEPPPPANSRPDRSGATVLAPPIMPSVARPQ